MPVVIALLRGVNVGGHHQIRMDCLRALCEPLGLRTPRTYVQSGNMIFRTDKRNMNTIASRLEDAIEQSAGFRPDVILRTAAEWKAAAANNPFLSREPFEPAKLLVLFLKTDPGEEARDKVLAIKTNPEELRVGERELYIYFPEGIGRSKLQTKLIEKALKTTGTARNWNTVTRMLALAEEMESSKNP